MDLPNWSYIEFSISPGINLKILNDLGRRHLESFGDLCVTAHLNVPATQALRTPVYSVILDERLLCHTHDIYLVNSMIANS